MKIILAAVEPALVAAWKTFCGDLDGVSVHEGSILDLRVDAVVSPANSFGFMDGGIDALYTDHFGWHVQRRLQELIRSAHHGELLGIGLQQPCNARHGFVWISDQSGFLTHHFVRALAGAQKGPMFGPGQLTAASANGPHVLDVKGTMMKKKRHAVCNPCGIVIDDFLKRRTEGA